MARELPITEFDMLTVNESMQMFKAMIPFLDYNLQKPLSIIIRMNELTQTINFYNNPRNYSTLASQSLNRSYISSVNDIFTNEEFLNTIMRYCPEKYAGMIENIKNFSKVSDIMNLFNSYEDGADLFNNPIILNMMNHMNMNGSDSNKAEPSKSSDETSSKQSDKKSDTHKKNASSMNMPDLFGALLTPEQKAQYDNYLKELSDL